MKLNKINALIAFVLCCLVIFFAIFYKNITLLLFCIYIILPFVFKIKPVITLCYLIFGFIAIFLGAQLHLYKITSWFDNMTHFIWGFLSGFLALLVLNKSKMFNTPNIIFNVVFIFIFSLATSALWEIFEFSLDYFFNQDMQRRATGVYDTMKDIIVTLFGNILFSLSFYFEYKDDKELLIKKFMKKI